MLTLHPQQIAIPKIAIPGFFVADLSDIYHISDTFNRVVYICPTSATKAIQIEHGQFIYTHIFTFFLKRDKIRDPFILRKRVPHL